MRKRQGTIAFALALAVCSGTAAADQAPQKLKTTQAAATSHAPDASSQVQRDTSLPAEDPVVAYRFHLAPAEPGTDLVIHNPSDQPAAFILIARAREGAAARRLKSDLDPGATFVLSSQDGWTPAGLAHVKASRRLRLGFQLPGGGEPLAIQLHAGAAAYEVFSLARHSEVALQNPLQNPTLQVEFISAGRRTAKKLGGAPAPFSELVKMSDGAESRGLFVAYSAKP